MNLCGFQVSLHTWKSTDLNQNTLNARSSAFKCFFSNVPQGAPCECEPTSIWTNDQVCDVRGHLPIRGLLVQPQTALVCLGKILSPSYSAMHPSQCECVWMLHSWCWYVCEGVTIRTSPFTNSAARASSCDEYELSQHLFPAFTFVGRHFNAQ